MRVVADVDTLRQIVANWRAQGERVAFVPTMGNLHQGHLSLVQLAKSKAQRCVVSIFVNPAQFEPKEDFTSYPRTLVCDQEKLTQQSVDLIFTPEVNSIYPTGKLNTFVDVPGVSADFCGQSRPGHFRGVATVVQILLNMVQADYAVFGEKDYQQLLVIRQMVKDLAMPVEIIAAPTYREPDGLAMSSRNQYLNPAQRAKAALLYQVIVQIKTQVLKGNDDYSQLQDVASQKLKDGGFVPDYVVIADNHDLTQPKRSSVRRILAAAWLGDCRLIDNLVC